jgi:hypothetical protein
MKMTMTKLALPVAVVALGVGLAPTSSASTASSADPCVSGQAVREQVHALVAGLHDDVHSKAARSAIRLELVQSMRTFRGARAETPEERKGLGKEISALASAQRDANTRLEGKALAAAIKALVEQRERGRFTASERDDLRAANRAVKRLTVAKVDGRAEGQAVAAAFRAIHEQFSCRP